MSRRGRRAALPGTTSVSARGLLGESLVVRCFAQDGGTHADYDFAHLPVASTLRRAREREVTRLAADGKTNHEIASELHLSVLTVRTHIQRAMTKLAARDRAQLVVLAYRNGLAPPHPDTT